MPKYLEDYTIFWLNAKVLQSDALDTPDMLCVLASKLSGVLTERWKREVSKVTSCKQGNLIWMTLHRAYQS